MSSLRGGEQQDGAFFSGQSGVLATHCDILDPCQGGSPSSRESQEESIVLNILTHLAEV